MKSDVMGLRRWLRAGSPMLVAAALAGGCNKDAITGDDAGQAVVADMTTPPQVLPAEVVMATAQYELDGAKAGTPQFDLTKIVDIWVRVRVPEGQLPDETVLQLTFVSPKGTQFYEDNAAFSKTMAHPVMNAPGIDVQLNTIQARKLDGGYYGLDRPIPIAGSAFDRYPQYGTWLLQASFDKAQPLLTTMFEVVTPTR